MIGLLLKYKRKWRFRNYNVKFLKEIIHLGGMSCLTLILVVAREPVNVKISCKRTMPQRAASKQQNTLNHSQEHTKNTGAKKGQKMQK